jgi:hypothetical protein
MLSQAEHDRSFVNSDKNFFFHSFGSRPQTRLFLYVAKKSIMLKYQATMLFLACLFCLTLPGQKPVGVTKKLSECIPSKTLVGSPILKNVANSLLFMMASCSLLPIKLIFGGYFVSKNNKKGLAYDWQV